ncbi:MAG: hypothetical protein JNK05_27570 [Myxococcales bacterium]|nr:hypothetical protein [Myxococcales bacterium]
MKKHLGSFLFLCASAAACSTPSTPSDAGIDTGIASDASAADAPTADTASPDAGAMDGGAPADSGVTSDATSGVDGSTVNDAANPFADAGALGEPAWVPITVLTSGSCPTLTPCGGAIAGTWDVSGACIEVPIASAVAMCPGAMITRSDGRARGRVVFGAAPMVARRIAQFEAQVDVFVPGICALAVGGCGAIERNLATINPMSTCAASPTGDCRCTSRSSSTIDDTDGYRTESNEIVSATLGKRWGYCVADGSLRYRDSSPSGPREPGVVTLRQR